MQSGDTPSSIAYAYFEYGDGGEHRRPQPADEAQHASWQIGQQIVILPPGSVDPVTGKLLPAGAARRHLLLRSQPSRPPSLTHAGGAAQPEPTTEPAEEAEPPVTYGPVQAEFVALERGVMFWVQDTNQVFVLTNGPMRWAAPTRRTRIPDGRDARG